MDEEFWPPAAVGVVRWWHTCTAVRKRSLGRVEHSEHQGFVTGYFLSTQRSEPAALQADEIVFASPFLGVGKLFAAPRVVALMLRVLMIPQLAKCRSTLFLE